MESITIKQSGRSQSQTVRFLTLTVLNAHVETSKERCSYMHDSPLKSTSLLHGVQSLLDAVSLSVRQGPFNVGRCFTVRQGARGAVIAGHCFTQC